MISHLLRLIRFKYNNNITTAVATIAILEISKIKPKVVHIAGGKLDKITWLEPDSDTVTEASALVSTIVNQ